MLLTILAVFARIFSNAYSNVVQKQLTSHSEPSLKVNCFSYIALSAVMIPCLPFLELEKLGAAFWAPMAASGILAAVGNACLIKAVNCGELSVLGPLNSYKVIVSMIVAFFLIGEIPGLWGIIGILLILAGSFAVMQKKLREQFRNDRITVSAHAVGGATLIDLLNWMERDIGNTPPDLITILIGTNDKSTGKSCASYAMQFNEYVGRLIAKTQGRSAILLINAVPGKYYRWDMMDDYADAVKEIGNRRGLPVCDLYGAMRALGREKVAGLLADLLHPNAAGHQAIGEIVANSVIQAE